MRLGKKSFKRGAKVILIFLKENKVDCKNKIRGSYL